MNGVKIKLITGKITWSILQRESHKLVTIHKEILYISGCIYLRFMSITDTFVQLVIDL